MILELLDTQTKFLKMPASLLLALPVYLLQHLYPSHFEHVIIIILLQSPWWYFFSFLLKPVGPHCFLPPHDFIGNIQYTTQQMEVVRSAGYVFFRSQGGHEELRICAVPSQVSHPSESLPRAESRPRRAAHLTCSLSWPVVLAALLIAAYWISGNFLIGWNVLARQ